METSMLILVLVVVALVGYIVYMKTKVKKYVLRNDKIEKYYNK